MSEADAQLVEGQPIEGQDEGGTEEPRYKGFQARVDELTKEKHEARAEAERVRSREAELLSTIARLSERPAEMQRAPDAPVAQLEPETQRAIEAMLRPHIERLEKATQQASQTATLSRFEQITMNVAPAIKERAMHLLPGVLKRGLPMEDALQFAAGELYLEGKLSASAPVVQLRTPGGQFTPAMMTSVGTPPAVAPPAAKGLPANFDRLPFKERMKILIDRGAADAPL
jgi:hypothetical protein